MWNLTLPLVTNEQSYLREEPIQGHSSLENPEEQEHWVLTRRGLVTYDSHTAISVVKRLFIGGCRNMVTSRNGILHSHNMCCTSTTMSDRFSAY